MEHDDGQESRRGRGDRDAEDHHTLIGHVQASANVIVSLAPPNESRFCCGAPLDSNTDGQNLTAPSAASAG
jgi:hypothetical protein